MSKTYSDERLAYIKKRWGVKDTNRAYFDSGNDDLDWKAYYIYRKGNKCRNKSGTAHGGKTKTWFGLILGENYVRQAYRLAEAAPDECPILSVTFNFSPGAKSTLDRMSIQHNPDGSLDWISNEANALISDKSASRLHNEATTANNEGNYELGKKLRACAQYVGLRERIAA